MNRKIAIGVLAGALLMSGLFVGVSYGGSPSTTEPTMLKLGWHTGGKRTHIRIYPLRQAEGYAPTGPVTGQVTAKKLPLFDVDGNSVGTQYIDCMATVDTSWVCTLVSVLKDGPYTDKGTVVVTGVSKHRGDFVSRMTVTGGTGAYNNVGGHVIAEGVDGHVTYTLFLVPPR